MSALAETNWEENISIYMRNVDTFLNHGIVTPLKTKLGFLMQLN